MSKAKALVQKLADDQQVQVQGTQRIQTIQGEILEPAGPKRNYKKIILFGVAFVLVGQFLFPEPVKPMTILAAPFVGFYSQMIQVSAKSAEEQALAQARAQVKAAEAIAAAQHKAEIERSRADAKANCGVLGLFSPDLGKACNGMVDGYQNTRRNSYRQ